MTLLSEMTLRLAQKVGSVRYSTATAGNSTELSDSLRSGMGEVTNGVVWFLSGQPAGLSRIITANPKDTIRYATLFGPPMDVTGMSYLLKVVTLQVVNSYSVGDQLEINGINSAFTAANIDGIWNLGAGTSATQIVFTVDDQPTGTTPQTITTGTIRQILSSSLVRYACVDKECPRDLLMAAVNAGLRMVNPRLVEDITTLVDPEVDKYTLPTDVRNIMDVGIAASLTAPLYYTRHNHWREVNGELRFDYGYAPRYEDAIIRLTYREQHEDLTDDLDEIPHEVDQEALFWRSMIELLSMLMSLRPKRQRYLDLFSEAQTESQRRAVTPPQRSNRLAGW